MNFLSHYYIDWQIDDPVYTLGKILPDLIRNFRGDLRVRPSNVEHEDSTLKSINRGIAHHYMVDKLFHQSTFFIENSAVVKKMMKEAGFASVKKYFYFHAHILFELMIDRLVMNHNNEVPVRFYNQLEMVKGETISKFFRYNNLGNQELDFMHFFSRFISSRYLISYSSNENLAYALGRINSRVGLSPFTGKDLNKLMALIPEVEQHLSGKFLSIFSELQLKLAK